MNHDPWVFLSHASADDLLADRLRQSLEEKGIHCWLDHSHIYPGERWPASIEGALSDCASSIILLTSAFTKSPICEAEYVQLLREGKKLYIAVSGEPAIPFILRIFQFVFLDARFDEAIDVLAYAIKLEKSILKVATPRDVQRGVAGRLMPFNRAIVRSVRLILDMSIEAFKAAADQFVRALSGLLGIDDDDITIIDIRPGSTVVTLRLPEAAAIQLVSLVRQRPKMLAEYPLRAATLLTAATHLEIVRPGHQLTHLQTPSDADLASLQTSSFLGFMRLAIKLFFLHSPNPRPRAAQLVDLYQSIRNTPLGNVTIVRSMLDSWRSDYTKHFQEKK